MIKKKDLVIVALATFCLTVTLFTVLPTKSNLGLGEYDSWNDLNDDGKIDIFDAINFAGTFDTSGDPIKNVSVTNFPIDLNGFLKTCDYLPSGTFNESTKIIIQTTSVVGYSNLAAVNPGILVWASPYNASFAFVFTPATEEFTIMKLRLQLTYWDYETSDNLVRFYLNNDEICSAYTRGPHCHTVVIPIQDQSSYATLRSGINILTVASVGDFYVQELDLLVEDQFTR